MNPHIEAAARAMAGAQWNIDRKAGLVQLMTREEWMDEYWPKIAVLLPAAIRAMREVPVTEKMIQAYKEVDVLNTIEEDCNADWRALLGAVVDEGRE